ncbi:MAG: hypothetical protein WCY89_08985, partial [Flavobacteriaceae bacterium]
MTLLSEFLYISLSSGWDSKFNNVATPVISFVAVIIYTITLYYSIKQNRIILSQNRTILSQGIKPFYDKEIDNLIEKAKKIKIIEDNLYRNKEINALNYVEFIKESLVSLYHNKDFMQEYNLDMIKKIRVIK